MSFSNRLLKLMAWAAKGKQLWHFARHKHRQASTAYGTSQEAFKMGQRGSLQRPSKWLIIQSVAVLAACSRTVDSSPLSVNACRKLWPLYLAVHSQVYELLSVCVEGVRSSNLLACTWQTEHMLQDVAAQASRHGNYLS